MSFYCEGSDDTTTSPVLERKTMNTKDILADLILAENDMRLIHESSGKVRDDNFLTRTEVKLYVGRSLPAIDKAIQLIRTEIVRVTK